MQAGAISPPVLQQIVEHQRIPLLGLHRNPLLPARAVRSISLVLRSRHTMLSTELKQQPQGERLRHYFLGDIWLAAKPSTCLRHDPSFPQMNMVP